MIIEYDEKEQSRQYYEKKDHRTVSSWHIMTHCSIHYIFKSNPLLLECFKQLPNFKLQLDTCNISILPLPAIFWMPHNEEKRKTMNKKNRNTYIMGCQFSFSSGPSSWPCCFALPTK